MTDIAAFHVKTVRAGEADLMDHDTHCSVIHDGYTYYYDLEGLGVSMSDFARFVQVAWEVDADDITVEIYNAESGSFRAWID